jgi:tetratricopeptide (TPR) repeat protein
VIDDERLQELLGKASSLYNNGHYQGAIEAWQEALSVDPSNQKAREGIRMATLLIGEWEPVASGRAGPEPAADAPDPDVSSLAPEEVEARLELGMARVKQLISERQFIEALEGAQGLLPLAPESEELQRLLEEARQGFESAPFVDEHLTLARELLEQERYAEAEAECRKIFVMDTRHPAGLALMKEIKERVQQSLQRAASQMGGMTVKLSLPQVPRRPDAAAGTRAPEKPAAAREAAVPDEPVAAAGPVAAGEAEPVGAGAAGAPEGITPAGEPILDLATGDLAKEQEEVRSRDLLEQAFEQAGEEAAPPGGPPVPETATGESPFEPAHDPTGSPETVEAKTVVPPRVRTAAQAPAPDDGTRPAAPVEPAPPSAPAVRAAGPKVTARPPSPSGPEEDPSAWEAELAQLNLKEGQRGILKGTGAKPGSIPVAESPDVDLMSLLDGDLGSGGGAEPAKAAAAPPPPAESKPSTMKPRPGARPEARRADPVTEVPVVRQAPAARPRGGDRSRSTPSPEPHPRSSVPRLFALLGLLIVAGAGAAWHFYFQPRLAAAGAGLPPVVGSPPQGTPAGPDVAPGPIPTPIGGPSRPQTQEAGPPAGEPGEAAVVNVAPAPAPPIEPPGSGGPAAAPGGEKRGAAPAGAPATYVPIKPEQTPRLSPEETRRRIASYTADGRRLLALGKWREARAKFVAVLALDPANLDVKEMADQAQAKIDDEQRLMNDMDSARQLVQDKDFENALRKLYRLPRDRGLGDIDLYIRNAWFNWAVVLLKAGNSKDAVNKLNEVLVIDPDDAEALRLQEVAERYTAKAKDRVYYAFTDTLRLRAFDQR